jgi:hypothetical protein
MKKMLLAATAVIVVPGLGPGVAHASADTYLQRVQEEIPYVLSEYGSTALLNEGYKVCSYEAQGMSRAEAAGRVEVDLPMSFFAADWVAILAENELGC